MDYTAQHQRYLSVPKEEEDIEFPKELIAGDVIQFFYDGKKRYAIVLNPLYQRRFHALAMENLPPLAVFRLLPFAKQQNALQLYRTYLARQAAFIAYDAYRTFFNERMSDIRRLTYGDITSKPATGDTTPNVKK